MPTMQTLLALSLLTSSVLLAGCQRGPVEPTTPEQPASPPIADASPPAPKSDRGLPEGIAKILPADAAPPTLETIENLDRLPTLDARHRQLLADHGFFIAPQAMPQPGQSKAAARTARRAKHLFQVYERNDYVRFPSYVTADLAIDLTHQYFDVVLRRTEREHLVPRLRTALVAFMTAAEDMRAKAKSPDAKKAAKAAAIYWGTALALLERPAKGDAADEVAVRNPWEDDPEYAAELAAEAAKQPKPPAPPTTTLPTSIRADVERRVAQIQAADRTQTFDDWGMKLDLTQTKPRGHYTGSGILQRYFRAMSVLGMSSFPIDGEDARPDLLSALTLSYEADPKARAAFEQVLEITSFVVGQPPTRGLADAAKARADAKAKTLDEAVDGTRRESIVAAWRTFPAHPVVDAGPVVQPIGQRVFGDTLAMSSMLPIVRDLQAGDEPIVATAMGAAGAAAALGHAPARSIVAASDPEAGPKLAAALDQGARELAAAPARGDAYHRTLSSLDALFATDPLYFDGEAFQLRMLGSFAGGWAMLRHDTLLYAYQMGAECDAEDQVPPYTFVEPATETYAGLRTMIADFQAKLDAAGIVDVRPEGESEWDTPFHPTAEKTKALDEFLAKLIAWSKLQAQGHRWTEDELTELATVGGYAEHVLLTLADAFELGEGNDDMAVIADVFTFRGQALEVGVSHPELIYAVIPTPDGWQVARGAVLGYREFFVAAADRMTDESWRERLAASKDMVAEGRPAWLQPISAPAVGVVELAKDERAQERCGYYGGAYEM